MSNIRLIVGLGNPGAQYALTRHNIGFWLVERLAWRHGITLAMEGRFKGRLGRGDMLGHDVRMLLPETFMNLSGDAVGAVARFYKIEPEEILVIYDEVAFLPGVIRLKSGGGHNGHNGIKSVAAGLGNRSEFLRLRVGVGHPGDKRLVTAYLTSHTLPEKERELIEQAFDFGRSAWQDILDGALQQAMNRIHAAPEDN